MRRGRLGSISTPTLPAFTVSNFSARTEPIFFFSFYVFWGKTSKLSLCLRPPVFLKNWLRRDNCLVCVARMRVTLKGTKALAWITTLVLKSERKMTALCCNLGASFPGTPWTLMMAVKPQMSKWRLFTVESGMNTLACADRWVLIVTSGKWDFT